MLKLDFEFEPNAHGPGGPYPDLWVDECQLGAFEGMQIIIVNDVDLSGPLPILGFARTVKMIANEFSKEMSSEAFYRDPTSEWTLVFRIHGANVEISDHRDGATISLADNRSTCRLLIDREYY